MCRTLLNVLKELLDFLLLINGKICFRSAVFMLQGRILSEDFKQGRDTMIYGACTVPSIFKDLKTDIIVNQSYLVLGIPKQNRLSN